MEPILALTDNFDATACVVRVESNPVPDGYQAATDIGAFVDELAADGTAQRCTWFVIFLLARTTAMQRSWACTATARGNFTGANSTYAATVASLGNPVVQTVAGDTSGAVDIVFADIAGSKPAMQHAMPSIPLVMFILSSAE